MSTTSDEHQRTLRESKIERLADAIRRIPPMSKKSLARWSEARDTYLGQAQPRLPQPERKMADISVELTDQSIQADLSRSLSELTSLADSDDSELVSMDLQRVECSDKATATEEDPIVRERTTSPSTHSRHIDTPDMLRTTSVSPTISVREQFLRIRHRFKRLSRQRRLLCCLLLVYSIILCALLLIICILLWMFHRESPVIYREVVFTSDGITDGVARYGEPCLQDQDCQRPMVCSRKKSSKSGTCDCSAKSRWVNDRCIGHLNAACTKDDDCQRFMLCTGMTDGERRCQCQASYTYHEEQQRCRGQFHAACESHADCLANLMCNRTMSPPSCSCELQYRYDPLEQKCRGDPGAVCKLATAQCTHHAECRDGACECAYHYVPHENKTCVDPCPIFALNPSRIRYPGNCRRFIDCQRKTKIECPEMTMFNFRTQLCDYARNVFDCR